MENLTEEEITLVKHCLLELLELEERLVDIELFWDANEGGRNIQGEVRNIIEKL